MPQRTRRATAIAFLLVLATVAASGTASASDPETKRLATVNGEELTTADLEVELFLMKSQQNSDRLVLPEPGDALQRMIQNTLLFQEGVRLGLDEDGMIANQVNESVRHRSVIALVDSVAMTVPVDAEDRRQKQFDAIGDYVESLKRKYDVKVDSTLLRSLDYGSDDPAVQEYLRNSEDVLCQSPTGAMRVRSLTRSLMFQEFHGLQGKPDADAIRDDHFRDWLTEALLTYESKRQGIPESEPMRMLARYQTRDLVLQETLGILARVRGEPTEQELRDFYEENIHHVTPPTQVKVESVILENEEAAVLFRERLIQGAEMGWLAERTAEVKENVAAIPDSWLLPSMIGLAPDEVALGEVLDAMEVPGGWVVAKIVDVREHDPVPLEECREDVLNRLRAQRTADAVTGAVRQLEEASEVVVEPDAESIVAAHMQEWKRKNDEDD